MNVITHRGEQSREPKERVVDGADEKSAGPANNRSKSGQNRRETPTSLLQLIELAYTLDRRKLTLLKKDWDSFVVEPNMASQEVETVKRLSLVDDKFAGPVTLLAFLAEFGVSGTVAKRLLELLELAFVSHPLFKAAAGSENEIVIPAGITAAKLSGTVDKLLPRDLDFQGSQEDFKRVQRLLRMNAVTAFGLFRVLRDDYPLDALVRDMAKYVWGDPQKESAAKTAAILTRNAIDGKALGRLARHFEARLISAEKKVRTAQAHSAFEADRASSAQAQNEALADALESQKRETAVLQAEVKELNHRLKEEQDQRTVDKSHLVDDYEALRTQILRSLTKQVALLSDGLHAIRSGSSGVAEEFVDRALTDINGEVMFLKNFNEGVA